MPLPPLPPPPPVAAPLVVGFSGGLDSTVLLHWLAADPTIGRRGLRAIHIHHGLQAQADDWADHCQQLAAQWQLELQVIRVQVDNHGQGMEAAARDARRQAFIHALRAGEQLVLAHHREDQAETFLLRALRGSGCDGLAAMQPWSRIGPHPLWRPLLDYSRQQLHRYAQAHALRWIDDPSNADTDFDRNFLRQQVLPLLARRWPHASQALAGSAARCAQDAQLLALHDQQLLAQLAGRHDYLPINALTALASNQRARLIRAWLRQRGAPPLPGQQHQRLDQQVLASAHDRQARVSWAGGWQLRRWRDQLHLLAPAPALDPGWQASWDGRQPLPLPDGSVWQLHGAPGFSRVLQVRLRQGGERLRLPGRTHATALKDCLQQAHLPPWQRLSLPLLWDGDELLAAGDALLAQGFSPPRVAAGACLQRCWPTAD